MVQQDAAGVWGVPKLLFVHPPRLGGRGLKPVRTFTAGFASALPALQLWIPASAGMTEDGAPGYDLPSDGDPGLSVSSARWRAASLRRAASA